MLTTLPIMFALCIGSEPPRRLSRLERFDAQQNLVLERYKKNPTGFNPNFGKNDPASHSTASMTFPHMSVANQAAAQKVGAEKTKEYFAQLRSNRPPVVLQMQWRFE